MSDLPDRKPEWHDGVPYCSEEWSEPPSALSREVTEAALRLAEALDAAHAEGERVVGDNRTLTAENVDRLLRAYDAATFTRVNAALTAYRKAKADAKGPKTTKAADPVKDRRPGESE